MMRRTKTKRVKLKIIKHYRKCDKEIRGWYDEEQKKIELIIRSHKRFDALLRTFLHEIAHASDHSFTEREADKISSILYSIPEIQHYAGYILAKALFNSIKKKSRWVWIEI